MKSIPSVILTYIEGLTCRDVNKIAGTVAEDLRVVTPLAVLTREQFLTFLGALYSAFPDWRYDHDEAELRGDVIAVKWRQGGTHTGSFAVPGLAPLGPTGKQIKIPAQFFYYRVRDNLIAEIRPDPIAGGAPHGILEQLGVHWTPA